MPNDLTRLLGAQENAALRDALLSLLTDQARAYTLGDSASLPAQVMQELLASLLYTLGVLPGASFAHLDARRLHAQYADGLRTLEDKTRRAKAVVRALCLSTPDYGSLALRSTLSGILAGLEHYDARFLAHRIPGEIDYQLALPVSEELPGIDFILCYLEHLSAELRFLSRFALHRVLALLDGASPDWRDAVSSLYEPIAANALGLALLGEDPRRLHIRDGQRQTLLLQLAPLHVLDFEHRLTRARDAVLDALGLRETQDRALLQAFASALAPRVRSAADAGELRHVFAAFALPRRAQDSP